MALPGIPIEQFVSIPLARVHHRLPLTAREGGEYRFWLLRSPSSGASALSPGGKERDEWMWVSTVSVTGFHEVTRAEPLAQLRAHG